MKVLQLNHTGGAPEQPDNWEIEFQWPADAKALSIIRDCVRCVLHGVGSSVCEDDMHKIELSVDEACTNVVLHAYAEEIDRKESAPCSIRIAMRLLHDRIDIEVSDSGRGDRLGPHLGFDEASLSLYGQTDTEDSSGVNRPHGLGIFIIKKCMDEVSLNYPHPRGTRLRMTKFIHPASKDRSPASPAELY
ncbi:ATP-binding protein [Candidatus Sumerlaeota bacterium]|nr:ATP-binding protein [Candidatus Sumerlaeota bacterium]